MLYVRPPVAAGSFYDLDSNLLKKQIEASFRKAEEKKIAGKKSIVKKTSVQVSSLGKPADFYAAIVPHAGYIYSGWVAAKVYSLLDVKKSTNFIILGTNHYMLGSKYAIMKSGLWKTPLGGVAIDESMTDELIRRCSLLENDVIPHQNEHSIEVQLPFLQYIFRNDFKFVPISIACDVADGTVLDDCKTIGKSIAEAVMDAVKKSKGDERWVILASSDFSHYVPSGLAEDVDMYVIKTILRLDENDFFDRVSERNASICGAGSIATAMVAAKTLGSKGGKLIKYATSGDVTGDNSAVVGYAGMIL